MARPDLDERFRRSKLERYLLAEELVIIAQHRHWAVIAEPFISAGGGLLLLLMAGIWQPPGILVKLLLCGWIALVIRAAYKWTLWWRSWLVATDKRLLLNYGLIQEGVAMIALGRVVDLTYTRSTLGQLLGYGTLVRESSGHSQTLHEVKFVKHPDTTYLTICATIFGLEDRARGQGEDQYGHRLDDSPPDHAPGLHAPYVPLEARGNPIESREGSDREDPSDSIRIRYGAPKRASQEPWHQSPDMRESALRESDTSALPYRRPATDASDGWVPTSDGENSDGGQPDNGDDDLGH